MGWKAQPTYFTVRFAVCFAKLLFISLSWQFDYVICFKDGDRIKIDIPNRLIELLVDEATLKSRQEKFKPFEPKVKSGYLYKYAKNVQDASHGAIV